MGTGGGLGMTFLPGKRHEGRHGRHHRDLQLDLARLRDEHGVGALLLPRYLPRRSMPFWIASSVS